MRIQNVPLCTGTTPACRNTCARGAGTHGDVLNLHTEVFSACQAAPQKCFEKKNPCRTNYSSIFSAKVQNLTVFSFIYMIRIRFFGPGELIQNGFRAAQYCFSGGPAPCQGLVLGRGLARFRRVRLGGYKVRKIRRNAVDVHDAADVFLYLDSSIAPLLDMRRRFKAVMDVLGAMIRHGVSLARSVELTAQSDKILSIGPLHLVTFDDFRAVEGFGLGDFHRVVSDVHHRFSDFIHQVVVHRRDEAIRGWRNWIREACSLPTCKRDWGCSSWGLYGWLSPCCCCGSFLQGSTR